MPGGRPRKPVAAKILAGTFRADRDGPPSSQVGAGGAPEAPARLSGEALALWGRVVPGLAASGVARSCDSEALAMMCEWWGRYRRFSEALDRALDAGESTYQLTLQVGIATTNFDRLAARFGLTPADRAKLRVDAAAAPRRVDARRRG